MRYQYVLFDLDGTLIDSRAVLAKAAAYSLEQCNAASLITPELILRFFGAPLYEAFNSFCGMSDQESKKAVKAFESYYLRECIYGAVLFDGMADALQALNEAGIRLALATNGAQSNAVRVLEHLGVARYFAAICGLSALGADETKVDVINKALRLLQAEDRRQAVMVGDRCYDMDAAKLCGLDTIGAVYGYGAAEELTACKPTSMAYTVSELLSLLLT